MRFVGGVKFVGATPPPPNKDQQRCYLAVVPGYCGCLLYLLNSHFFKLLLHSLTLTKTVVYFMEEVIIIH